MKRTVIILLVLVVVLIVGVGALYLYKMNSDTIQVVQENSQNSQTNKKVSTEAVPSEVSIKENKTEKIIVQEENKSKEGGGGGGAGTSSEGGSEGGAGAGTTTPTTPPPTTPPPESGGYQFWASLNDVTNSEEVLGVNTAGNAAGDALSKLEDGNYELTATITGLPNPLNDDFYEGWIARTSGSFSAISVGKAIKNGNEYKIIFSDNSDLTDHTQFVLTIEHNDGDPSPGDHVLEGNFETLN